MRGSDAGAGSLFRYADLEDLIPPRHPLRKIRSAINDALRSLDGRSRLYRAGGGVMVAFDWVCSQASSRRDRAGGSWRPRSARRPRCAAAGRATRWRRQSRDGGLKNRRSLLDQIGHGLRHAIHFKLRSMMAMARR